MIALLRMFCIETVAHVIILPPLCFIGEGGVGFLDLFEPFLLFLIAAVGIGMEFLGLSAVGTLELVFTST